MFCQIYKTSLDEIELCKYIAKLCGYIAKDLIVFQTIIGISRIEIPMHAV